MRNQDIFRRSCYVGYTATPFANIFIDPDQDDDVVKEDLFPKHFIIGLDAPSNYFGSRAVFLDGVPDEAEPTHLRFISDNEELLPIRHKIDHVVGVLPPSMIAALRAFMVARTIRNLRGQQAQHASMLVNASRFTRVQGDLRNRLREATQRIVDAARINGSMGEAGLRDPEIAALKAVWTAEYRDAFPDWQTIQAALFDAIAGSKVVEVNSKANELDYDEAGGRGLTVIAVGGFSLSRGLTLEGLTVSYFLRNSMMYDTLMQMGRWFGYRGGYRDLCRIWMPREAADWYAHIAEATEELHEELRRMERAKATPEQFGLAVRSHPSSLMVTARNKLGSGEKHVMIGLSNNFVETTKLTLDDGILEANRDAARRLLRAFEGAGFAEEKAEDVSGGLLLEHVPVSLIDQFLLEFRNAKESVLTETRPIRQYIDRRSADELSKWDVLIASVGKPEARDPILGWSIGPAWRAVTAPEVLDGLLAISGKRSRVASRGVERVGVEEQAAQEVERKYREREAIPPEERVNYPDHIYRAARIMPLFILHLLNVRLPKEEVDEKAQIKLPKKPVIAWGISFPVSGNPDERVEYIVNTTKLKEMFGEEEFDEGTFADDD